MRLQIQERSRHDVAELVREVVADGLYVAVDATMHNLSQGIDEAIHLETACGTNAETIAVHLDYDIAITPPAVAHHFTLRALHVTGVNLDLCLAHVLHVVAHACVHVVGPASFV